LNWKGRGVRHCAKLTTDLLPRNAAYRLVRAELYDRANTTNTHRREKRKKFLHWVTCCDAEERRKNNLQAFIKLKPLAGAIAHTRSFGLSAASASLNFPWRQWKTQRRTGPCWIQLGVAWQVGGQ